MSDNISSRFEFGIEHEWITNAAIGGGVLGGGGGGSLDEGLDFGRLAVNYGNPHIRSLDTFADDTSILTVSAVGAPGAADRCVSPKDYVRAVELVVDQLADSNTRIGALMTNEMGGFATVNGLVQSSVTGLPVVDAACNGRAHPTGAMGSMGLPSEQEYVQAAVGGSRSAGDHIELVVTSSLDTAADTIRQAAEDAGGLVAVARNPISAAYARDHAACEVYEQAVSIGRIIRNAESGDSAAQHVADHLDGTVPIIGEVETVSLETTGGFDVGSVSIDDAELTFWNEYMTVERDGTRLGTFPDLITTLDTETGRPIPTADLRTGQSVAVITAPADSLSLGAGMTRPELFEPVESAVGKPVIDHAFSRESGDVPN